MSPVNGRTVNGYRSLLTPIDFFPAGSVSGSPVKTAPFYQLTGTHKATVDSYTVVGCGRLAAGNDTNGPSFPSQQGRLAALRARCQQAVPAGSDQRACSPLPAAAYRRATGSGKLAFHRPVAGYPRSAEPVASGRGGMSRLPAASRRRGRGSGRAR